MFSVVHNKVRKTVITLLKAFFKRRIILMILISYLWIIGTVHLLYTINLWNYSMLKDTIIWSVITSFLMIMKYTTYNQKLPTTKELLLDAIKLIVIIEFMSNLYTFSLITELIFVPSIVFIGLLYAVSKTNKQYKIATNFLGGVLGLVGLGIIIYSFNQIWYHFDEVAQIQTALNYAFPVLMTVLFLPFVYIVINFIRWENNEKKTF